MKKFFNFKLTILMVWTIGILPTNGIAQGADYGIYKWNGSGWDRGPGGGIKITVDENGNPWVANSKKDIYKFIGNTFEKLPGQANDIAVGGGKVWVIGNDRVGSGSDYGIYAWNGKGWDKAPGGGVRIAVDDKGLPWIVNSNKDIYQFTSANNFIKQPGKANDIGIGGGKVWVIGNDPVGTGVDYGIYKWNGTGWDKAPGGGTMIAVDEHGFPWVTNSIKDIYQFTSDNSFVKHQGQANDIGIGGGKICLIGNALPEVPLTHDSYLQDFMDGKVVLIPTNIDCIAYRAWVLGVNDRHVKLISDKPFTVYWKIARGFIRTDDPAAEAQREIFNKDGKTYYAYTWEKRDDFITWAEIGIQVKNAPANMKLTTHDGIPTIWTTTFPFRILED